ncbi:MAG TPA: rRNA maturation RNase YbeY [Chthoniobacteraceae bacterium]|nr:rRNA maturation RNase YbeY [Chthoniobacteraceae bacterium]
MEITFSNRQRAVKINTAWLANFSKIALAECLRHPPLQNAVLAGLEGVDVVIVSNKVISDIHRRFMDVDGPTDVITFDHGEIIISAPMARTQAREFGTRLDHEIGLYIIHGLLHLNGYDDKTTQEARVMHKLQNRVHTACLARR